MQLTTSFCFSAAAGLILLTQLGHLEAQDVTVGQKDSRGPIRVKSLGILMKQYDLTQDVHVEEYKIKSELGNIVRRQANATAPKSNLTTIDLTPADCEDAQCYPGAFDKPNTTDCDAVWRAQLYNSTGSLTAFPGTFVYVFSGNCAVVFQNPQDQGYAIQFNWAKLGAVGVKIANKCLAPDTNAIGGICQYKNRGGAGNLVKSGVPTDPNELSIEEDLVANEERSKRVLSPRSHGRGGAGNIRSPSRDVSQRAEEAEKLKRLDKEDRRIEEAYDERTRNSAHSTGRGGAGNIH